MKSEYKQSMIIILPFLIQIVYSSRWNVRPYIDEYLENPEEITIDNVVDFVKLRRERGYGYTVYTYAESSEIEDVIEPHLEKLSSSKKEIHTTMVYGENVEGGNNLKEFSENLFNNISTEIDWKSDNLLISVFLKDNAVKINISV